MTHDLHAPLLAPSPVLVSEQAADPLLLRVLGHTHITRSGTPLHLSSKATALLCYLSLEKMAHHREHLAELLWDSSDALLNLRVELNRLKQQQLNFFAARQPMLSLRLPLDIERWISQGPHITPGKLSAWLSEVRGLPLSGLEDLGTSEFQHWLDRQRMSLLDQIEAQLNQVGQRMARLGAPQELEHLDQTVRALGLELTISNSRGHSLKPASFPHYLQEERKALLQIMESGLNSPQLVILRGPPDSSRELLAHFSPPSPWQMIEVQYSPQRAQLQRALIYQAMAALPADTRRSLSQLLLQSPPDEQLDILRLGQVLNELGTPIIIACHEVCEVPQWLRESVQFLMQLPLPLVLIGSPSIIETTKGEALAQIDWRRLHRLDLPPLTTRQVYGQLLHLQPQQSPDARQAQAAQIIQSTTGWLPYVQEALHSGRETLHIPDQLCARLRAVYGHLEPRLRLALSKLAQMHDRFSPAFARALLGPEAETALSIGLNTELLVQSSAQERVDFPSWAWYLDDQEEFLSFSHELNRIALASSLPAAERQALRIRLAELLLPEQPALAVRYAQRAGAQALAQAALSQLPAQVTLPHRVAPAPMVSAPPYPHGPERVLSTPNGYRLTHTDGCLEIQRRGWPFNPPQLILSGWQLQPGPWSLELRLDVAPTCSTSGERPAHALAVRTAHGPWHTYAPSSIPESEINGVPSQFVGTIPTQRWIKLSGHHQQAAQPLELSVCAMDIALTISRLEIGGRRLI